MELFREVGLESRITELGKEMATPDSDGDWVDAGKALPMQMVGASTIADLTSASVLEVHHVQTELSPCRPRWCGQDRYERLLLDRACDQGAEVRFGAEVVSFEQDDEGVTVVAHNRRTRQDATIRADYLLGADGVRSPVRKALGIGQRSYGNAGTLVNIVFRAKIELPPKAPQFTWALTFHPEAHGILNELAPDRWLKLVHIATGMPDLDVEFESAIPWKAVHMVADNYRSGRVFLAGDACHTHPPAGGFGLNAGIQDAHNLAWKLGAVMHGSAEPSLLDSYEAERRPVGEVTADQTVGRTMSIGQARAASVQNAMRELLAQQWVGELFRDVAEHQAGSVRLAERLRPLDAASHAFRQEGDHRPPDSRHRLLSR